MEYKKLAITGANGYLGKHTIKAAIQKGWQVVGIVRRDDAAKEVESLGAKPIIIKEFNIESLKNALIGCKAVLHLRGVVCGSEQLFEKINIQGMRVLVQAAFEAKVSRIIFPSGLGVDRYGTEEWANDAYFHSKNVAEQILKNGKVPYIIFRPSYILGPEDELIPEIIEQIGKGIVQVAGDGKIPMQPIFVKDAVEAFLATAEGVGENNQIFDLVGPTIINMLELIELVVKIMVELGFNIPQPRTNNISFEDAPEQLGICKEMIDVMRCDITSNGNIVAEAFNFKLSELKKAIKAAVVAKMFPEVKKNREKAILLLSGGIDSAVALYWAQNKDYEVIALSFNYNLRPEQEKKATKKLVDNLNIKLIEVPIQYMKEAIDLRIEGFTIPCAVNAPEGFIPSRNLVFYSIAAYFAEIYDCKSIIGGHISVDPIKFPDAAPNFFKTLEKLVNKGKHNKDKSTIKIVLPLSKMTKINVINLGNELNVPFEWTWSCYSDGEQPCGKCNSCRKRDEAFLNLNYSKPKFPL
ncbi:MAG: 7-cyano-7-deazaguanine synthase [Candidatus Lokiarchaeota archaeon]|nr:7-cyano-7-deazaguanine synthase [Candidatus Lokiarchaeota archaeon]